MTVATIGAVAAAVWGLIILCYAGTCVYAWLAGRADGILDRWPDDVEEAICEALALSDEALPDEALDTRPEMPTS